MSTDCVIPKGEKKVENNESSSFVVTNANDDALYDDLDDAKPAELPPSLSPVIMDGAPPRKKLKAGETRSAKATPPVSQDQGDTTKTAGSNTFQKQSPPPPAVRSLVQEVEYLQERERLLGQENEILKRNMGTLYRTAMAEIQRKDEEMARLVFNK
jgi:hypothetical protein